MLGSMLLVSAKINKKIYSLLSLIFPHSVLNAHPLHIPEALEYSFVPKQSFVFNSGLFNSNWSLFIELHLT